MNLITRNYRPLHARSVALHACARAASPSIATYRCLHGCLQPPQSMTRTLSLRQAGA